ncbi:MAG: hypothetical protein HXX18_06325 [Bacteroidetes bacterium]|nr:hypothetical protein [Bacteroidota bacterium]
MLNLPNLQIDNLYKFKFYTGISILLFAAYLYSNQINSSISKSIETRIEIKKSELQVKYIDKKISEIKFEIDNYNKEFKKIKFGKIDTLFDFEKFSLKILNDKNYREYLQFLINNRFKLLPVQIKYDNINNLILEYDKILNEFEKNSINIEILIIKSKYEYFKLIVMAIITFLIFLFGIKFTNKSYNEWYEFVQKPLDEKLKLELEKLKSEKNEIN